MIAGAPKDQIEAVGAYGEKVGVVFQLADDVLDVAFSGETRASCRGRTARARPDHAGAAAAAMSASGAATSDDRLLVALDGDLSSDEAHGRGGGAAARPRGARRGRATRRTPSPVRPQALLDPLPDSDAKAALQALAVSVVHPRRLFHCRRPPSSERSAPLDERSAPLD